MTNSYSTIEHLLPSFDRYVQQHRIPTGGFLQACLENNLTEAVGRADFININLLPDIVRYMYNELPADSWGSPERVQAWLARRTKED
jgi:hypothetical protein